MLYHKIEGPFKRSEDLKTVDRAQWRNPVVEMLSDAPVWVATEKIDGTNIRVIWDGYGISFGGRTDRADIPKHLLEHLKTTFLRAGVEEWFEENFPVREGIDPPKVILFGEGYGPKIQSGGKYRKDVSFVGFDVAVNGKYLSPQNVKGVYRSIGVDYLVPISSAPTTLRNLIEAVELGLESAFGDFEPEGLVARPVEPLYDQRGNRVIVKLKAVDLA